MIHTEEKSGKIFVCVYMVLRYVLLYDHDKANTLTMRSLPLSNQSALYERAGSLI